MAGSPSGEFGLLGFRGRRKLIWIYLQLAEPSVFLNGEAVDVASDPLSNIAHNYKAFAEGDTSGYLDFEHAVKRHELIEAIERSAREGVRVDL